MYIGVHYWNLFTDSTMGFIAIFHHQLGKHVDVFATTLSKSKNIAEAVVVCKTNPLSIFVHATFIGRYL